MATAFHYGAVAGRSLPSERARDDERPAALAHRTGGHRHRRWLAREQGNGGVLLDYDSREVVVHGLSMPHSPRWYRNRLWVLESSRGSLGTVDLASGKVESVARVPGFARGLDFCRPARVHRPVAIARNQHVHGHLRQR